MENNREVATKDFMDGYAQGFKDGVENAKKYFECNPSRNLDDNIHRMSVEENVKISKLIIALISVSDYVNYIPSSVKNDLYESFKFFSEVTNNE